MRTGLATLLGLLVGNLLSMLFGFVTGNEQAKLVGAGQAVAYLLGLLVYSRLYWRHSRATRCPGRGRDTGSIVVKSIQLCWVRDSYRSR